MTIYDYNDGDTVSVEADEVYVMNDFVGTIVFIDHDNGLVSVQDADEDVFDCDLEQLTKVPD